MSKYMIKNIVKSDKDSKKVFIMIKYQQQMHFKMH